MTKAINGFPPPPPRPPETGPPQPAPVQVPVRPQQTWQPPLNFAGRSGAAKFAGLLPGAASAASAPRARPSQSRLSIGVRASGQTSPAPEPLPRPASARPVSGSAGSASAAGAEHGLISTHPADQTPPESQSLSQRPYRPITLQTYPSYGRHQKAAVSCTDYARQAAESLIDHQGRLDPTHIPRMLDDLKNEKNVPAHHREHLRRTLSQLQKNPELATTINTVCEHKPLRGPAADMVRATLNLPADRAESGVVEARKALVMSLLGNLRQGEVGSCFATAPAIILLDSSPEIVIRHMKELLEDNKLTFRKEGLEIEVPLNQRISRARAQVALVVQGNGTCSGRVGGRMVEPYKLHETPGMHGALTALGIAPHEMEEAVGSAVRKLRQSRDMNYRVTSQQILEQLSYVCPDPKKAFAAALNAFAGKEDVRLLRAWEYTLASTAEVHSNDKHMQEIAANTLSGPRNADKPELRSLHDKAIAFQHTLPFEHAPIREIREAQFADIEALMRQRFCLLYDADIEQGIIAGDGVSARGGFTLYQRIPADDPSKWQRIDNPKAFQTAMAELVEGASEVTRGKLSSMPGFPGFNSEMLRQMTRNLTKNIGENSFIEQVEHTAPSGDDGQPTLPWKQSRGGRCAPLMDDLGAKTVSSDNRHTSGAQHADEAATAGGGPKKRWDATHVIEFFCDELKKMEPALHAKALQTHPDFKVTVSCYAHVFSLMPMAFEGAWKAGSGSPQQWINEKLIKPALEYRDAQRTRPVLFTLLQSMGRQLGARPSQIDQMYRAIAGTRMQRDGQPYSLRRVHEELAEYCKHQQDGDLLRRQAERYLAMIVPVPAIPFADTNWSSEAGDPKLIEASYDPFKHRVEANIVDHSSGYKQLVEQSWLDHSWQLSSPVMPAA